VVEEVGGNDYGESWFEEKRLGITFDSDIKDSVTGGFKLEVSGSRQGIAQIDNHVVPLGHN